MTTIRNSTFVICRPVAMTDTVFLDDPSEVIAAHYAQVWESGTAPAGEINPRLSVAVLSFVRCQDDWLGAVITPWAIHLILMNGGGCLWGDIPPGQLRYVRLPGGAQGFIADGDPEIGAWQYASLLDSIGEVVDMRAARLIANDGLRLALGLSAEAVDQPVEPKPPVSRRGFLRRLAGKRD